MASRWHILDEFLRRGYELFASYEPANEDAEESYVLSLTGEKGFFGVKKTLTAAFDELVRQAQDHKEPNDG